MQPILNMDVFSLHERNLLKCHFEFMLTQETRDHEMPTGRAEGEPSIS